MPQSNRSEFGWPRHFIITTLYSCHDTTLYEQMGIRDSDLRANSALCQDRFLILRKTLSFDVMHSVSVPYTDDSLHGV